MDKMLEIALKTGIKSRNSAFTWGHPVLFAKDSPPVDKQRELFLNAGVEQASASARKAIAEWGGDLRQITHIIGVSSMAFSNPGFEFFVAKNIGLSENVERILLNGVGCSGGLAGLRNAAHIACGMSFRGLPARILVVSTELSSAMTRAELDLVHNTQEVRIAATLFGDASTAIILSNGIGPNPPKCKPVYDVYAWQLNTLKDCHDDISLNLYTEGMSPSFHLVLWYLHPLQVGAPT
jgi:fungal type III polyketide synthase